MQLRWPLWTWKPGPTVDNITLRSKSLEYLVLHKSVLSHEYLILILINPYQ